MMEKKVTSITWRCQSWPKNLSSGGGRLVTGVPCKVCEPTFTGHDSLPPPQVCESILMQQAWWVAGSGHQTAGIFIKVKVFRLGVIPSQSCCRIHCRILLMHRISHYLLLVAKFQRGGFQSCNYSSIICHLLHLLTVPQLSNARCRLFTLFVHHGKNTEHHDSMTGSV